MSDRKIKAALISVYHKDGLEEIVRTLHGLGVQLISTGGTESFVKSLGIPVTAVESLTGFPEILGGRVKTLHPKIFGGILSRRDFTEDQQEMKKHNLPDIDLVIVGLYPFEETVREHTHSSKEGRGEEESREWKDRKVLVPGKDFSEAIEKIDIGGISLIRAAAKNFNDVLVCASGNDYGDLLKLLYEKSGISSLADRYQFATKAFDVSSHYDAAIFQYFSKAALSNHREQKKMTDEPQDIPFTQSILQSRTLRYGENPHQQGRFYGDADAIFSQLHGKEISYNNLVDVDAAIKLIDEFERPACAVIKHTNACGCAEAADVLHAWELALAGDPVSAFGGIIVFNGWVNKATAEKVNELFFEVIIAPGYDEDALSILSQKKNRIILNRKSKIENGKSFKSLLNGVIEQDADVALSSPATWKVATTISPAQQQSEDLLFAEKCVKHLKSNAIALVRNKQLIGMGCGQTSRVDALKQAINKAKSSGFDLKGSVMASDAFFPFSDCVEMANQELISAILQPGGSVRDKDSIDACNKYGKCMVMTGLRHFLH